MVSKGMKLWLAFALSMAVGACASTDYINDTKIEDTPENRELLKVLERYRRAMERRDTAALLAMAHPWYFEDSGTSKGDDDYGYEGLKQVLQKRMDQVKSVRYGMQYKKARIKGNRARVQVFIDASFQMTTENGDKWQRKVDDNELELLKDDRGWRFLAGM